MDYVAENGIPGYCWGIIIATQAISPALGQDKKLLVIGAVQPLTGWAALGGENVVAGIKIALEKVKASGELEVPFALIVEEGKGDYLDSANAIEKLIRRDKVPAIIGCWASSATLATIPVMKRN